MDDLKPLSVSVASAGRILDSGRTKVMDLIRTGRLSAVVLDNRIRVTTASIEALYASLPGYVPGKMPDLHPQHPLPKRKAKRARRRAK